MKITIVHWKFPKPISDSKEYPIKIRIADKGIVHYSHLKIFVLPKDFDENDNGGRVRKTHPNAILYNQKISNELNKVEGAYFKNPTQSVQQLLEGPQKKITTVNEYFDRFIKEAKIGKATFRGKRYAINTIEVYEGAKKKIDEYCKLTKKELQFSDITIKFYNDFVFFLRQVGLKDNSVGSCMHIIKAIYSRAGEDGFHSNSGKFIKIIRRNVENIYLTLTEIKAIECLEVPKNLETEKDRFLVSYYFISRFGDSLNIKKHNLYFENGGWIYKAIHEKTGNRVEIPVGELAYNILEKYNFIIPKTYNHTAIRRIQKICKLAGINSEVVISEEGIDENQGKTVQNTYKKWELVTTHTARRSMATHLLKSKELDLKQIQLLGGWKTMASMEKYFKSTMSETVQEVKHISLFSRKAEPILKVA